MIEFYEHVNHIYGVAVVLIFIVGETGVFLAFGVAEGVALGVTGMKVGVVNIISNEGFGGTGDTIFLFPRDRIIINTNANMRITAKIIIFPNITLLLSGK